MYVGRVIVDNCKVATKCQKKGRLCENFGYETSHSGGGFLEKVAVNSLS
jgi:hypothetical protein